MRDYPTLHLDSNKKKVATFVFLFHEHLTLWEQYSVILVFIMPMSHTIHSVVRHYRTVRRVIIICLSKNREHNGHNKKEQKDKKKLCKTYI